MQYTSVYNSPLGEILLACDDAGLTGLWFGGEKYYACGLEREHEERETQTFSLTKKWLDIYFSAKKPDFTPPLHMAGSPFQLMVWKLLLQIPHGKTTTYGELARLVAARRGIARMSAQAVGGAVGRNAISIIVPCHRVIGKNGSLTGYAGGMDKKANLLALEGMDMTRLFIPAKYAAT